ncbi:phosphopantetheinyl transferase [Deinococcus metalli]|uniref:Phosphopantetheinyl transferase n=1 Tax=Deinococcus metalli TaxID=1141878 RepID=A0A7W8KG51_9DEIO|nr:4'-phosphopantetheinyl transferase superfamily protein [Deinococcus metalli]MBB5376493.1 phosphopantetheinyl transferase [Deinococcus metalli]GHF43623.1 hypothetical protein GCM10017781_20080 [Deinococcus metalli]
MTRPAVGEVWLELSDLTRCPPDPDDASWLDDAERQRAGQFVAAPDRERFVRRRMTLRRRLADLTGRPPAEVNYTTGPHGRPELTPVPRTPDVRFSVSSAGPLLLLAFTCAADVGVDIEEVRAYPELDDVAAQVLTEGQRTRLASLDRAARTGAFFDAWTALEARQKLSGQGFAVGWSPEALPTHAIHEAGWSLKDTGGRRSYRAALATHGTVNRVRWTVPGHIAVEGGPRVPPERDVAATR